MNRMPIGGLGIIAEGPAPAGNACVVRARIGEVASKRKALG
jgi:hypothetical protein